MYINCNLVSPSFRSSMLSSVLSFWWGCSSLGKARDWHAADAGLIPRLGKGFSPRVNFQCRLSYGVRTTRCAIACINICVRVKDPAVHVRVRWIMKTLKHPVCIVGWVARLCRSSLSPGKATRSFRGRNPNGTIQLLRKKYGNMRVVNSIFMLSLFIFHYLNVQMRPCYDSRPIQTILARNIVVNHTSFLQWKHVSFSHTARYVMQLSRAPRINEYPNRSQDKNIFYVLTHILL